MGWFLMFVMLIPLLGHAVEPTRYHVRDSKALSPKPRQQWERVRRLLGRRESRS